MCIQCDRVEFRKSIFGLWLIQSLLSLRILCLKYWQVLYRSEQYSYWSLNNSVYSAQKRHIGNPTWMRYLFISINPQAPMDSAKVGALFTQFFIFLFLFLSLAWKKYSEFVLNLKLEIWVYPWVRKHNGWQLG